MGDSVPILSSLSHCPKTGFAVKMAPSGPAPGTLLKTGLYRQFEPMDVLVIDHVERPNERLAALAILLVDRIRMVGPIAGACGFDLGFVVRVDLLSHFQRLGESQFFHVVCHRMLRSEEHTSELQSL